MECLAAAVAMAAIVLGFVIATYLSRNMESYSPGFPRDDVPLPPVRRKGKSKGKGKSKR